MESGCTGTIVFSEFYPDHEGALVHDAYTYCPVHDGAPARLAVDSLPAATAAPVEQSRGPTQEQQMSVRAKMRVTKVTSYEAPAGAKEVHFAAVFGNTDPNDVNKKWSMWTPSGELRLHINNPEAAKQFEPGMFFFVDLHPTTKDA